MQVFENCVADTRVSSSVGKPGPEARVSATEKRIVRQLYARQVLIDDESASSISITPSPDAPVHPTEEAIFAGLSDYSDISVDR